MCVPVVPCNVFFIEEQVSSAPSAPAFIPRCGEPDDPGWSRAFQPFQPLAHVSELCGHPLKIDDHLFWLEEILPNHSARIPEVFTNCKNAPDQTADANEERPRLPPEGWEAVRKLRRFSSIASMR